MGRLTEARVWYCFAAAVVIACGSRAPDETIDVTFDPCALAIAAAGDCTQAERESIELGLSMWNEAANLRLEPASTDGLPALLIRFEDAHPAFRGVYDDERGIVFVNRRLSDPHARAVTVAHEIGHAFGLVHVDAAERRSLMNPGNVEVLPTPLDVTRLRALWGNCSER